MILSDSMFYGMTESGGANGDGTVFSINANGTGFHNLLSFTGSNGAYLAQIPLAI